MSYNSILQYGSVVFIDRELLIIEIERQKYLYDVGDIDYKIEKHRGIYF